MKFKTKIKGIYSFVLIAKNFKVIIKPLKYTFIYNNI